MFLLMKMSVMQLQTTLSQKIVLLKWRRSGRSSSAQSVTSSLAWLPIPCCSSGYILCKKCKQKIIYNREMGDKPCPVCHSPLCRTTNYLVGTLISFFTDIPCPNKISGCSFIGTLYDVKTHLYLFKMVCCIVYDEEGTEKIPSCITARTASSKMLETPLISQLVQYWKSKDRQLCTAK